LIADGTGSNIIIYIFCHTTRIFIAFTHVGNSNISFLFLLEIKFSIKDIHLPNNIFVLILSFSSLFNNFGI